MTGLGVLTQVVSCRLECINNWERKGEPGTIPTPGIILTARLLIQVMAIDSKLAAINILTGAIIKH